uniref:U21-Sparatoxin-Hju1j_1 n=1 Tax=Heteropoda jugulans TaxID=1358901 RepID=A0A4Q8KAS3_9ARAC
MNSKLCILVVIALCLTLVHAGGKYCPEPKEGAVPHEVQGQSMLQAKRLPSQSTCCKLPCGNVCLRESPVATNGVPVKDGEPCEPSYYN